MMDDSGFDYEQLGSCQYGSYAGRYSDVEDCGEPACYRVWWKEDGSDAMLVCTEHFQFILKTEENHTSEPPMPGVTTGTVEKRSKDDLA